MYFEKAECLDCLEEGCNNMGYHASPLNRGVKFLFTRSKPPFCLKSYPYVVEVTISSLNSKNSAGQIRVSFQIAFDTINVVLTK